MASNGCEELMQAWFPIATTTERMSLTKRKSLTESDIRDIARILIRTSNVSWSRIPRIYSILRIIDQLHAIDSFLAEGITDVWLPFSQKSLPASFQTQSARLDFLDAQQLVFNTKALNLERKHTRHGHFTDATEVPLKKIGELGKGGYGFVDRVVSTFSHREYARKLIPRGRTFKKDKQVLQAFERELSSLKSISQQHMHIVDLVGSYTDPKYVGIIMLPVADCNLHEFLLRPLDDGEKSLLRTFFGCLTSALCFLHDSRIRHKDIKPQNVLIKSGHVFLTDFGVSLDWSELSHSTTTGPTSSTPRYGAPEVAEHSPRNSSADIWSLGCVFLEIWTVLKKEIVQTLHNHMASSGTLSFCYYSNLVSIGSWIEIVKRLPGPPTDNVPSAWIAQMLKRDREARWTAHTLAEHIHEYSSDPTTPFAFAGLCCLVDDDTAESVHSSIGDDMNGLILQPTTSPVSRLYPSEPIPLLRQTEAVTICEVPITISPYIQPMKRAQISPHHVQPSSSSSADPGYVSRAIKTSDTLGRVPLPGNLLSAAETYSKDAVDIPGQLDMRKSFQDQSHRNYPPQPYIEEKEVGVAREIHTTVKNPARTHVWSSENGNVESSDSKRWVFFTSEMDERPSSNPRNNINAYPKVPEMIYHSPQPTSGKKYDYPKPKSGVDLSPKDVGVENGHRVLPRPNRNQTPNGGLRLDPDVVEVENGHRVLPRPSRNQTYSPSPLPSSPTGLHKENLRVDCLVCMNDDLPVNKTAKLICGHRMCHSCLKRLFVLSVNDPAYMPPRCCTFKRIPFNIHVMRLFDDEFRDLWNKRYKEYITENKLFCPSQGCGGWFKPKKIHLDRTSGMTYVYCSRCMTKLCIRCNSKLHTQRECPNDEKTDRLAQMAKDQGWQRCHSCKAVVDPKEGCNYMTCSFTAQSCMVCALPWKTCNCLWFD